MSKGQYHFQRRINITQLLASEKGELKKDILFDQNLLQDKRIKLLTPILGQAILVKKTSNLISVNFNLKVKAEFICERCLDVFKKELKIKFTQDYSFIKKRKENNILPIFPDQTIEIFEPIRQEIIFELPFQIVCKKDCQGLCDKCGQNLNQKQCQHKKGKVEPAF